MRLFIDRYQDTANSETKSAADRAGRDGDDLKRRIDALTLASQALWEIVREQTGLDDEAVILKMQEIDLRDGVADGRISQPPVACPKCSRNNRAGRNSCIYCGAAMPGPAGLGG